MTYKSAWTRPTSTLTSVTSESDCVKPLVIHQSVGMDSDSGQRVDELGRSGPLNNPEEREALTPSRLSCYFESNGLAVGYGNSWSFANEVARSNIAERQMQSNATIPTICSPHTPLNRVVSRDPNEFHSSRLPEARGFATPQRTCTRTLLFDTAVTAEPWPTVDPHPKLGLGVLNFRFKRALNSPAGPPKKRHVSQNAPGLRRHPGAVLGDFNILPGYPYRPAPDDQYPLCSGMGSGSPLNQTGQSSYSEQKRPEGALQHGSTLMPEIVGSQDEKLDRTLGFESLRPPYLSSNDQIAGTKGDTPQQRTIAQSLAIVRANKLAKYVCAIPRNPFDIEKPGSVELSIENFHSQTPSTVMGKFEDPYANLTNFADSDCDRYPFGLDLSNRQRHETGHGPSFQHARTLTPNVIGNNMVFGQVQRDPSLLIGDVLQGLESHADPQGSERKISKPVDRLLPETPTKLPGSAKFMAPIYLPIREQTSCAEVAADFRAQTPENPGPRQQPSGVFQDQHGRPRISPAGYAIDSDDDGEETTPWDYYFNKQRVRASSRKRQIELSEILISTPSMVTRNLNVSGNLVNPSVLTQPTNPLQRPSLQQPPTASTRRTSFKKQAEHTQWKNRDPFSLAVSQPETISIPDTPDREIPIFKSIPIKDRMCPPKTPPSTKANPKTPRTDPTPKSEKVLKTLRKTAQEPPTTKSMEILRQEQAASMIIQKEVEAERIQRSKDLWGEEIAESEEAKLRRIEEERRRAEEKEARQLESLRKQEAARRAQLEKKQRLAEEELAREERELAENETKRLKREADRKRNAEAEQIALEAKRLKAIAIIQADREKVEKEAAEKEQQRLLAAGQAAAVQAEAEELKKLKEKQVLLRTQALSLTPKKVNTASKETATTPQTETETLAIRATEMEIDEASEEEDSLFVSDEPFQKSTADRNAKTAAQLQLQQLREDAQIKQKEGTSRTVKTGSSGRPVSGTLTKNSGSNAVQALEKVAIRAPRGKPGWAKLTPISVPEPGLDVGEEVSSPSVTPITRGLFGPSDNIAQVAKIQPTPNTQLDHIGDSVSQRPAAKATEPRSALLSGQPVKEASYSDAIANPRITFLSPNVPQRGPDDILNQGFRILASPTKTTLLSRDTSQEEEENKSTSPIFQQNLRRISHEAQQRQNDAKALLSRSTADEQILDIRTVTEKFPAKRVRIEEQKLKHLGKEKKRRTDKQKLERREKDTEKYRQQKRREILADAKERGINITEDSLKYQVEIHVQRKEANLRRRLERQAQTLSVTQQPANSQISTHETLTKFSNFESQINTDDDLTVEQLSRIRAAKASKDRKIAIARERIPGFHQTSQIKSVNDLADLDSDEDEESNQDETAQGLVEGDGDEDEDMDGSDFDSDADGPHLLLPKPHKLGALRKPTNSYPLNPQNFQKFPTLLPKNILNLPAKPRDMSVSLGPEPLVVNIYRVMQQRILKNVIHPTKLVNNYGSIKDANLRINYEVEKFQNSGISIFSTTVEEDEHGYLTSSIGHDREKTTITKFYVEVESRLANTLEGYSEELFPQTRESVVYHVWQTIIMKEDDEDTEGTEDELFDDASDSGEQTPENDTSSPADMPDTEEQANQAEEEEDLETQLEREIEAELTQAGAESSDEDEVEKSIAAHIEPTLQPTKEQVSGSTATASAEHETSFASTITSTSAIVSQQPSTTGSNDSCSLPVRSPPHPPTTALYRPAKTLLSTHTLRTMANTAAAEAMITLSKPPQPRISWIHMHLDLTNQLRKSVQEANEDAEGRRLFRAQLESDPESVPWVTWGTLALEVEEARLQGPKN